MSSNSTEKIPDEDSEKEKLLQKKLSEQKELLSKLKSALTKSGKKNNSEDVEFLLKRF